MIPARAIRHFQWFFSFLFLLVLVSFALAGNPNVIKASHNDVSLPLSHMAVGASSNSGGGRKQKSPPPAPPAAATKTQPTPAARAPPAAGASVSPCFFV